MLSSVHKALLKPSTIPISYRFFSQTTHHHHRRKNPFPRNPNIPNPSKPTAASFDELVQTAGRSRDFPSLARLLEKRTKEGVFNTSNTFKFLTENHQDPNTILDDLIKTLSNLPHGFTRKQAFDSLVIHLSKSDHINESLRVIATMIHGAYGVNACTFHPLLNILTRKKRFEESWNVISFMRDNGVAVDVTSYNYILTSYCFNGELEEAGRVVRKIVEDGMKADARTYDAMVLGACRVGKVEGALRFFGRMQEEKVSALYCTYVHVISGLVGLGCSKKAIEFVRMVGGKDKMLDTENFGYLLSLFVRKRRVDDAKLMFEEMDKRGLKLGDKLREEYKSLLENKT